MNELLNKKKVAALFCIGQGIFNIFFLGTTYLGYAGMRFDLLSALVYLTLMSFASYGAGWAIASFWNYVYRTRGGQKNVSRFGR